jgi:hypothetical protein
MKEQANIKSILIFQAKDINSLCIVSGEFSQGIQLQNEHLYTAILFQVMVVLGQAE